MRAPGGWEDGAAPVPGRFRYAPGVNETGPAAAGVPGRTPGCPRCGYDLTGLVGTWRGECPLEGRCSECGLDFAWRNVLSAREWAPRWSYEHGLRAGPIRLLKTAARALWPWALWRGLTIELRVARGRLWLLVVPFLLVLHGLALVTALLFSEEVQPLADYDSELHWLADNLPVFVLPEGYMIGGVPMCIVMGIFVVALGMMPVLMLILRQSFRRAKLRRVHLVRGYCWSWVGFLTLVMTGILATGAVERLGGTPRVAGLVMGAIVVLWMKVWWHTFIKRYLRLRHSFWVASLLMIITVLGAPIIAVMILMPIMSYMGWD